MSEALYEVAFSGKIVEGANPAQVKAKIGAMFKADAARLEQMFSGNRIVIKKNVDAATAKKFHAAFKNAGAICEVKSQAAGKAPSAEQKPAAVGRPAPAASKKASVTSGNAPEAPQTDPLGITASDISELSASLAPVGSLVQDAIKEVPAPSLDVSNLGMAPVGSDLGQKPKEKSPPPPDTSGITLADN